MALNIYITFFVSCKFNNLNQNEPVRCISIGNKEKKFKKYFLEINTLTYSIFFPHILNDITKFQDLDNLNNELPKTSKSINQKLAACFANKKSMAVNPMTYRSNSDSLVYLYVKDQLYDDHCVESVENIL